MHPWPVVAWLGGLVLGAFLLLALWLSGRRLVGAFRFPLPPLMLLLVGLGTALLTVLVHRSLAASWWPSRDGGRRLLRWTLALASIALAAAVSLPGSSLPGLTWLWGLVLATSGWLVLEAPLSASRAPPLERALDPHSPASPPYEPDEVSGLAHDIEQQLTRGRDESGQEFLHGTARVQMAPRQRTANLHVVICPPWKVAPTIQVEQVAGPAAEIRVGLVLPQGIRFDVRRLEATDVDAAIGLEFFGH